MPEAAAEPAGARVSRPAAARLRGGPRELATPANDAAGADAHEPVVEPEPDPEPKARPKGKKPVGHGRRGRVDLAGLPVERIVVDPPEVVAAGGEGYERIGEETSDRIAHRPASHFVLRIVTSKWVKVEPGAPRTLVAAETPPSV